MRRNVPWYIIPVGLVTTLILVATISLITTISLINTIGVIWSCCHYRFFVATLG